MFDREKARDVLIHRDPWTDDDPPKFDQTILDALEACVLPDAEVSEPQTFTVDQELLDLHAVELAARTRLPVGYARESLMRLVDVLIPAVVPVTPPQSIDRDALIEVLRESVEDGMPFREGVDRILALLKPNPQSEQAQAGTTMKAAPAAEWVALRIRAERAEAKLSKVETLCEAAYPPQVFISDVRAILAGEDA